MEGADPLLQAAGGKLPEQADPYILTVDPARSGVAEYLMDEIRAALRLAGTPADPVTGYLLPGPAVPLSVTEGDGSVFFDGDTLRLEWDWKTNDTKSARGPVTLPVTEITAVGWQPSIRIENGFLRFTVRGVTGTAVAKHDPHAIELWGFKKHPLTEVAAAAVQARLPHPRAHRPALPPAPAPRSALTSASASASTGPGRHPLESFLPEIGQICCDPDAPESRIVRCTRNWSIT